MMPEQETDLSTILSDLNARVRILESKYNTFGERLLVVNQNMIEEYKHMVSDIRAIDSDVRELQREILRLKESMHDIKASFFEKDYTCILFSHESYHSVSTQKKSR